MPQVQLGLDRVWQGPHPCVCVADQERGCNGCVCVCVQTLGGIVWDFIGHSCTKHWRVLHTKDILDANVKICASIAILDTREAYKISPCLPPVIMHGRGIYQYTGLFPCMGHPL